ncbi:hypothetical protein Tco_0215810 [Tanacetum coccineum]
MKQREQMQISRDKEVALKLQDEFDAAERQRIARVHEEASSFNIKEWEDIQATIEADEELAQRIQEEEREKYSKAEKARLLAKLINQRKRYFSQQRDEERWNKPLTQAQQRTYMCNYIKHMGSHTLQQLKRLSFDELKALFETTMRRVQTFHPIESEADKIVPELTTGSSKRVSKVELDHEGSKKQKTNEASGSVQEQPEEEETDLSQEDLQQMMMVVPVEEVYVEASERIGSHTLQQLKRLSFDELKDLFETTMRRVQTFYPIESEGDKTVHGLTTRSSKRVAEVELDHEGSRKQNTNEASGLVQEQPEEEET